MVGGESQGAVDGGDSLVGSLFPVGFTIFLLGSSYCIPAQSQSEQVVGVEFAGLEVDVFLHSIGGILEAECAVVGRRKVFKQI